MDDGLLNPEMGNGPFWQHDQTGHIRALCATARRGRTSGTVEHLCEHSKVRKRASGTPIAIRARVRRATTRTVVILESLGPGVGGAGARWGG